jgi:hypothetical protein
MEGDSMGGLILLFIIALWVFLVTKLTKFLSKWIPVSKFSPALKVLLFILLLVMPFMDEIIGGFQFRALCKAEAVATYDEAKVRGKTVHLKTLDRVNLTGTVLPMYKRTLKYIDVTSQEELLSYVDIHADGGWLSRWIDFNSVHKPYTFDGNCSGDKDGYLFQNLNIKDAERN